MEYTEYIKEELLILIPVLYIVGMVLKKSRFSDKKIPLILGVISIMLSAVWIIGTGNICNIRDVLISVFSAVTQGVLIAGASVYANQMYVQLKKEEEK